MDKNFSSTFESKVREFGSRSIVWKLKNWNDTHDVLMATQASCMLQFEKPKISVRLFLQPIDKTRQLNRKEHHIKYYSLCADVLESNFSGAVKVNTKIHLDNETTVSWDGGIIVMRNKKEPGCVVNEEFIAVRVWTIEGYVNRNLSPFTPSSISSKIFQQQDITINFQCTLFELAGGCSDVSTGIPDTKLTEPELSMLTHMKALYAAEDNFSDLKLETKDNMTLSTHKFQLAARSPMFRTMIEESVKKPGFDGVLKIGDVNAKPMIAILHWIYSGELHENAWKVMEDVVEAAVKYQLVDLLKLLDKKLIEICNAENMFQLFNLAKKIPMPTAIEDISLFIKEHLA